MNQPFAMGYDPEALARALAIADPRARQDAINSLTRTGSRRIVNPDAGAMSTESIPHVAPPADTSLRMACQLADVGLRVLLRDVPLNEIESHPDAIRGAQTLAAFVVGNSTELAPPAALLARQYGPRGLFRLNVNRMPADRVGRLALEPIPNGWGAPSRFDSYLRLGAYGATEAAWQALERGNVSETVTLSPQPVPLATLRAEASLVHQDTPLAIMNDVLKQLHFAGAPRSPRFPARPNDQGFITGGGIFDAECSHGAGAESGGRKTWRFKFYDYRGQRPHQLWPRAVRGELHESFLRLAGWIVERVGPFLPMVYPEGPPPHPTWPSGHAFFGGYGGTLLKAWFADGPVPRLGITSSLHAEIDAMAFKVGDGRISGGIHFDEDVRQGLLLGQTYAIRHLNAAMPRSPQPLAPTEFLGYDGRIVRLAMP